MPAIKPIHARSLDAQRRIHHDFGELIKLAYRGNKIAAEYVHDTLHTQIRTFVYLCDKSPELFRPIARKKSVWPAFITTDAEIALDNDAFAAKLKLGFASMIQSPERRPLPTYGNSADR
jgi:hypothetical protein